MTEAAPQASKSPAKRFFILVIKIAASAGCFWYISTKIDFGKAVGTLKEANKLYLLMGLFLYFVSKIIASIRLNIYFKNIGIRLSQTSNFKLYLLGLFYNLFLPGSIGGDAYKVILLKKKLNAPYRKTSTAVLLDRFTGLLGLGLVLCFYSFLVVVNKWYAAAILTSFFLSVIITFFSMRKWAKEFLPGFWSTFFYGLLVQLFANVSAYLIILSLGITTHLNEYLFIFLVASVAAVLPITLGGLGAREIVFYQLSNYFKLDIHGSVLIGLLFYFMVVITSATGLVYLFKDPLKDIESDI